MNLRDQINQEIKVNDKANARIVGEELENLGRQYYYHPKTILEESAYQINKNGILYCDNFNTGYLAQTIYEFDYPVLMLDSIPEKLRTFALATYDDLKSEFNCHTKSQKMKIHNVTMA